MQSEAEEAELNQKPLSHGEIERLVAAGLIPRREAHAELRERIDWSGWLRRWLEALGSIFLMAGILFFFAHNWKELSPLMRFTILEAGVAVTVIAALITGIRTSAGQWLISGACLLTGVLVAVFGQVYQTGADAFEVFAMWAALILLWVALAKFAPLWVFWLVIAETALILFGGQVIVPDEIVPWSAVFLGLAFFTLAALAVFELGQKKVEWLRHDWIRVTLVTAAVFWFSAVPWRWIMDFGSRNDNEGPFFIIGSILWLAACITGFRFYSTGKNATLSGVSPCILSPALISVFLLARTILEDDWDNGAGWLFVGIVAIVTFSAAAWIIIKLGKKISSEEFRINRVGSANKPS